MKLLTFKEEKGGRNINWKKKIKSLITIIRNLNKLNNCRAGSFRLKLTNKNWLKKSDWFFNHKNCN